MKQKTRMSNMLAGLLVVFVILMIVAAIAAFFL